MKLRLNIYPSSNEYEFLFFNKDGKLHRISQPAQVIISGNEEFHYYWHNGSCYDVRRT